KAQILRFRYTTQKLKAAGHGPPLLVVMPDFFNEADDNFQTRKPGCYPGCPRSDVRPDAISVQSPGED
ncbi:hypothetical protein, partial [Roseobacter sp.]|uniref:hypothetical protein n=1 Tax=Roseobacter sp. TaxID=1907202 RepID=UPI0025D1254C